MEKKETKADFITAFWKLYDKKEIDKISIRELCQSAGYNRTTFYAHYENIYDLLNKAIENIFIPIKETILTSIDFHNLLNNNQIERIFLNAFRKEDKHIETLFRRQHSFLLGEKMKAAFLSLAKEKMPHSSINHQEFSYLLEYQISAIFGVVKYWFLNGKTLTEDELIEMIYKISTNGVLSIIQNKISKYPSIQ